MFSTGCTEQHCPNWSNGPVGAPHMSPQQFPLSPGCNCFLSSGYNGGLFIPPGYDGNPPAFHMSCPPRWPCALGGSPCPMEQFYMEPFFGPGCTCFFPHECNSNIFIPPGYNSSPTPFHMQHHWNHFSTDQYNLAPSSIPDHSPADLETNTTEDSLSNNNIETEKCEPGLAPAHCQVMPTSREKQLDNVVENMHVDNMTQLSEITMDLIFKPETRHMKIKPDLVPGKFPEKSSETPVSSKESIQQHNGELIIWETEMPQHLTEAFIGEEGHYLKFVRQSCGGLVYMSTHPRTQDYMVCNIMGTKHQVYKALDLIRKKIKCQGLKNIYSPPTVTFGGYMNEAETPKKDQNGHSITGEACVSHEGPESHKAVLRSA